MKIRILPHARDDLLDGFHFYEKKKQHLGDYFLTCLYSDVESLKIYGGIHARPYRNLHRALSKRFPFAIYYTVNDQEVRVLAIIDCRRSPSWIRRRLNQR